MIMSSVCQEISQEILVDSIALHLTTKCRQKNWRLNEFEEPRGRHSVSDNSFELQLNMILSQLDIKCERYDSQLHLIFVFKRTECGYGLHSTFLTPGEGTVDVTFEAEFETHRIKMNKILGVNVISLFANPKVRSSSC
jgi:hypothetical protein